MKKLFALFVLFALVFTIEAKSSPPLLEHQNFNYSFSVNVDILAPLTADIHNYFKLLEIININSQGDSYPLRCLLSKTAYDNKNLSNPELFLKNFKYTVHDTRLKNFHSNFSKNKDYSFTGYSKRE
jgi:hypothetical protein